MTTIDVRANGDDCGGRQRLARYDFAYVPDADTGLPRLNSVDILGREGTTEAAARIPVARYAYGSMTESSLSYHLSQTLAVPASVPISMKDGLGTTTTVTHAGGHQTFATVHAIADFNGDGRADMVHGPAGAAEIALGRSTSLSATGAPMTDFGPSSSLGLTLPLAQHTATSSRYGYGDTVTYDDTHIQLIDMNGDGRVDLLESKERDYWTLYLNTPNGPDDIIWSERRIDTTAIRQNLVDRQLLPPGYDSRLPLSRSATGWTISYQLCYVESSFDWEDPTVTPVFCELNSLVAVGALQQRTVTMWSLDDINGDGYPDFVANELPVARVRIANTHGDCDEKHRPAENPFQLPGVDEITCREDYSLQFTDDAYPVKGSPQQTSRSNRLVVNYNKAGHQLADQTSPFSVPVTLPGESACAASEWVSDSQSLPYPQSYSRADLAALSVNPDTGIPYEALSPPAVVFETSYQRCGLADVNADGLLDRVSGTTATLGTGAEFSGDLAMPGWLARTHSGRHAACTVEDGEPAPEDDTAYAISRESGFVDLTADGIPDYVSNGQIWIGTGTGWAAPKPISWTSGFSLSRTQETCGGQTPSIVKDGLYDLDGDGRLEHVRMTDAGIEVQRIAAANGTRMGLPEAGRLTGVSNGYGATSFYMYTSAKNDQYSRHDVPFSEIVVSETYASASGSDLAPTKFAYSDVHMRFDAAADRWVSSGYTRQVVLRGVASSGDTQGARIKGVAQISHHRPPTAGGGDFEDYVLAGAPTIVHTLDGDFTDDPWKLLYFENTTANSLLHGQTWMTYEAVQRSSGGLDCLQMSDYYVAPPIQQIGDGYDWPCASTTYGYPKKTTRWQGESVIGPQVRTAQAIEDVDDLGRPLRIWNQGDLSDFDDDTCQEITYTTAGPHGIRDAVHEVLVTDCDSKGPKLLSRMRMAYDGHADVKSGGFAPVTFGRPTTITTYRYETQLGSEQGRLVATIDYDEYGNVRERVVTDGATFRTNTHSNPDAFRLGFRDAAVSASDVALSFPTSATFDPFTLEPLTSTDAHGTTAVRTYDGFGRALTSGVIPAGSSAITPISKVSYLGFQEEGERRVSRVDYMTEGSGDPRSSTTYIDSLGRIKYVESTLGSDYADSIISGSVIYDKLGRVAFARDAYAKNSPGPAYGTTYFYQADGTVECSVRGAGIMSLVTVSDEANDIYPTCYEREYVGVQLAVRVRGPNELLPGSPQYQAYDEDLVTATGRVLERSRWVGGERRELVRFAYDPLGSTTRMSRYSNPAAPSGRLDWVFSRDSAGRALVMSEPSAPPRFMEYDNWGNLEDASWDEPNGERRLKYEYDALGRVTHELELRDGADVPGSAVTYKYDEASPDPDRGFRLGRLSSAESYETGGKVAMKVEYGYDALGRTRAVSRTNHDLQPYHERYEYRLDGQLEHVTFRLPDSGYAEEIASYTYDTAGRMSGVSWADATGAQDLFTANTIDPFGQYLHVTYGNGVEERREYNPINRRELKSTYLRTPQGDELATSYTSYTPDLRVRERVDTKLPAVGSPELERTTYDYDGLHQMTRATTYHAGGGVIREQAYGYDALGNMRTVDDVTGPNDSTVSYRSDDPDRVCRVEPSTGGSTLPPTAMPPGGAVLPPSDVRVWLEAEAGAIVPPMVPGRGNAVSQGAYVWAPDGAGDSKGGTVLTFTVPKSGNYIVWGRVLATTSTSDSFYVRMDAGSKLTWAIPRSASWTWRRMKHSTGPDPQLFALSAGTHTLTIGNREDGTRIDRLFITDQLSLDPSTIETKAVPREVSVEAESGLVEAPMAMSLDADASAGAYMSVPKGQILSNRLPPDGAITYDLDVPENGYYSVWMRVRTPNNGSDSFHVAIDPPSDPKSQTWWSWHTGTNTSWTAKKVHHWDGAQHVPIIVWLNAGEHTLVARVRETGAEVDQIMLATYVATTPATPPAAPPDDCQYRYDPSGNVIALDTSATPSRSFGYDGRGRITSMVSGSALGKYQYGPEGDIIAFDLLGTGVATDRKDRHFGPHVTRGYFETETTSEERTERRIPGLPIARRGHGPGAELVYAHGEASGVRRATNGLGALTQEKLYDPYGGIIEDTGTSNGLHSIPGGFQGGDHLAAFGIVNIGARIYDPRTGRFLQRDPLIIPRTAGMMNPYAFAWNDPINFGDPTGLDPCRADFCISTTGPDNDHPASGLAGVAGWGVYRAFLFFRDFWSGPGQGGFAGPHVVVPDVVTGNLATPGASDIIGWPRGPVKLNQVSQAARDAQAAADGPSTYEAGLFAFRQGINVAPLNPISAPIATSVGLGDAVGRDIATLNSGTDPLTRMFLLKRIEMNLQLGIANAVGAGMLPGIGSAAGKVGTAGGGTTTFFRGTTYGDALETVQAQALNVERIAANQSMSPPAGELGAYLTSQPATATHYASIAGVQGRGLGPAVLRIEVPTSTFGAFAERFGIKVEQLIPRGPFPGATETVIPQSLIDSFNKMARFFIH